MGSGAKRRARVMISTTSSVRMGTVHMGTVVTGTVGMATVRADTVYPRLV